MLRSRSTKKPCHRFVLFFDRSLSILPATEWCNKNIWLHIWFSRGNSVEIAYIFLRFYVASREIDKNVLFFWHMRTFLDNWSIDFIKKSNLFSPVVLVSRYMYMKKSLITRLVQWCCWVNNGRVCLIFDVIESDVDVIKNNAICTPS